ncbi:hypothetical protein D3C77_520430 [compost metagenome]
MRTTSSIGSRTGRPSVSPEAGRPARGNNRTQARHATINSIDSHITQSASNVLIRYPPANVTTAKPSEPQARMTV